MNCCLQKLTTHQFTYVLCISGQFQKCKNYQNPTSTSKDTYKTIFIILFKLFSFDDSFEFKVSREMRLI